MSGGQMQLGKVGLKRAQPGPPPAAGRTPPLTTHCLSKRWISAISGGIVGAVQNARLEIVPRAAHRRGGSNGGEAIESLERLVMTAAGNKTCPSTCKRSMRLPACRAVWKDFSRLPSCGSTGRTSGGEGC